jgi:hypothetical protein
MSKKATTMLVVAGVALILMTIALLWSLGPEEEEGAPRRGGVEAARTAPAGRGAVVPSRRRAPPAPVRASVDRQPPSVTPAPAPAPAPVVAPAPTPAPAAAPDPPSSSDRLVQVPVPGTHMAPPVIPAEIKNETDPVRRAQLERMHDLAVARSRASRLRRRARMLRGTIAQARETGSWTTDKIDRAAKDLEALNSAIGLAEKNVELATKRAGISDKDK